MECNDLCSVGIFIGVGAGTGLAADTLPLPNRPAQAQNCFDYVPNVSTRERNEEVSTGSGQPMKKPPITTVRVRIEKHGELYTAESPDLPGLHLIGEKRGDVLKDIPNAIQYLYKTKLSPYSP